MPATECFARHVYLPAGLLTSLYPTLRMCFWCVVGICLLCVARIRQLVSLVSVTQQQLVPCMAASKPCSGY
jgi:hypothetical protein